MSHFPAAPTEGCAALQSTPGDEAGARCCTVQADTALGTLRLTIPMPPKLRSGAGYDSVDVALAVQRCELLLLELEAWLGCAVDPAPVHACMPLSPGHTATVRNASLAPEGTCFHLPWAALLGRMPPPGLQGACIVWPVLRCEVELARYVEPPAERSRLQPGSVLLLPQSFQPGWPVGLVDLNGQVAISACLGVQDHQLHALRLHCPPAPAPMPAPAGWRVVLSQPMEVPAELALGWQEEPRLSIPIGAYARLLDASIQPAELGETSPLAAKLWAEGVVIPALQGAALLLDPVHAQVA